MWSSWVQKTRRYWCTQWVAPLSSGSTIQYSSLDTRTHHSSSTLPRIDRSSWWWITPSILWTSWAFRWTRTFTYWCYATASSGERDKSAAPRHSLPKPFYRRNRGYCMEKGGAHTSIDEHGASCASAGTCCKERGCWYGDGRWQRGARGARDGGGELIGDTGVASIQHLPSGRFCDQGHDNSCRLLQDSTGLSVSSGQPSVR